MLGYTSLIWDRIDFFYFADGRLFVVTNSKLVNLDNSFRLNDSSSFWLCLKVNYFNIFALWHNLNVVSYFRGELEALLLRDC